MKSFVLASVAQRSFGRLAFIATVGLLATGVAGIVALHVSDHQPIFANIAYAAFAEVEDSPIEEIAEPGPRAIRRARDGLFYAMLTVNAKPLRCIVDTGATATVISAADGRRVGLDGPLHFNGRIRTVGGDRQAARGQLTDVALAGHSFRHVPALFVHGGPSPCLLGQDLIARLDGAEIRGDRLILR